MSDDQNDAILPGGKKESDVVRPDEFRGKDFDTAPVLDEETGAVLLSQDIRDEQEAAGYVADIQPKATALAAVPGPVGTTLQPTGNLAVLTAVQAANDPDSPIQVPDATKESDTEIVVDPAVGNAGVSPSLKQLKQDVPAEPVAPATQDEHA